jgi:hypothetical protein
VNYRGAPAAFASLWLLLVLTIPAYGAPEPVELHYLGHTIQPGFKAHYDRSTWNQLYSAIAIRSSSGTTHRLKADPEFGYFVASDDSNFSPGNKYVVVEQLDGGYVESDGEREWHEVDYCAFIEVDTATLVTRETGEICGGEFTGPNTWQSPNGENLDLATPKQ